MTLPRWAWRFVVIPLALVTLVTLAWVRTEAKHAKQLSSPNAARRLGQPIPVRTALVADERVSAVIGATAVTIPSTRVQLRFGTGSQLNRLNTTLAAIHVKNGDFVRAGEVLVEFDTGHFERLLTQEKQALAAAQAALTEAQATKAENVITRQVELEASATELEFREQDVEYRKNDHDRLKDLRDQRHASLTEYLEAASAYGEARYRLTLARLRDRTAKADMVIGPLRDQRGIEAAKLTVDEGVASVSLAEDNVRRCRVRTPIDGFVDGLTVCAGQVVDTDFIVASVLRLDPVWVQVDFPQERIGDVAVGLIAEVVFDSFPKETFAGKVVRVGARLDEATRVLPVIVEVLNPDHRIKAGVSSFARIHLDHEATTVPAVAVVDLLSNAMAFVVEDGRAATRRVRTGQLLKTGYVEVVDGLEEGDEVVVYGQQYLRDGEAVDTNWRHWGRRD